MGGDTSVCNTNTKQSSHGQTTALLSQKPRPAGPPQTSSRVMRKLKVHLHWLKKVHPKIKLLGSNAGPAEVPMNTRILTANFYYTKDVNLPKPFSLLVSPFCPKILCPNHPLLRNVHTLGSLTKKVSLSQPFLPSLPPSLRKGFTF